MKNAEFNGLLERRVDQIYEVLKVKGDEYGNIEDRLHNFRVAANLMGLPMAEVLWGMALKHVVSVVDIVQGAHPTTFSREHCEEKIGDLINYLILLEAVLEEEQPERATAGDIANEMAADFYEKGK